ncbi:MAG: hypothetical protein M1820_002838 [Bogoriella megaspora]|nr:MAG: hypothetical protein M1820_002838 [Bogoriella megaspora]
MYQGDLTGTDEASSWQQLESFRTRSQGEDGTVNMQQIVRRTVDRYSLLKLSFVHWDRRSLSWSVLLEAGANPQYPRRQSPCVHSATSCPGLNVAISWVMWANKRADAAEPGGLSPSMWSHCSRAARSTAIAQSGAKAKKGDGATNFVTAGRHSTRDGGLTPRNDDRASAAQRSRPYASLCLSSSTN